MIRVTGDDGFCTMPLPPKRLDALFIVKTVISAKIKQLYVYKTLNI